MVDVPSFDELVEVVRAAARPSGLYLNETRARAILDAVLPLVVGPAGEDTARLDWLDSVNLKSNERNGTVYGWKYDINHNRAALTDHNIPALTVREAIDAARFPEKLAEITLNSIREQVRRKDFDEQFPGVRERAAGHHARRK